MDLLAIICVIVLFLLIYYYYLIISKSIITRELLSGAPMDGVFGAEAQ